MAVVPIQTYDGLAVARDRSEQLELAVPPLGCSAPANERFQRERTFGSQPWEDLNWSRATSGLCSDEDSFPAHASLKRHFDTAIPHLKRPRIELRGSENAITSSMFDPKLCFAQFSPSNQAVLAHNNSRPREKSAIMTSARDRTLQRFLTSPPVFGSPPRTVPHSANATSILG